MDGLNVSIERLWTESGANDVTVPKAVLEKERIDAFEASVLFIKEVHRKNGFDIGVI
jgi:hypothetical protein